ncbi:hypothetical protein BKA81DRAFT_107893 [Phyllosticta paracitricarpa]
MQPVRGKQTQIRNTLASGPPRPSTSCCAVPPKAIQQKQRSEQRRGHNQSTAQQQHNDHDGRQQQLRSCPTALLNQPATKRSITFCTPSEPRGFQNPLSTQRVPLGRYPASQHA